MRVEGTKVVTWGLVAGGLAVLWGVGACGASQQDESYRCEVDEALLAQRTACVADDQCPCGSHCEAGLCVYECLEDADCEAGLACNAFGRCVELDGDGAESWAPPEGGGRLRVSPSFVELDARRREGAFVIEREGRPVAPVRVVASQGLSVQCGEGEAPASECRIEVLSEGAPRAVRVRLDGASGDPVTSTVWVFGPSERVPVHVRVLPDSDAGAVAPLEGVYRGEATLVSLGTVARSLDLPAPGALADMRFPVELRVHPERDGRRLVVLSDALGWLFPERAVVGVLHVDEDGELRLEHEPVRFARSASVDGASVAASGRSGPIRRGEAGFGFSWRSTLLGISKQDAAPYLQWRVALVRVGDLPADEPRPSPSGPDGFADVEALADVALAAEGAMEAALPVLAGSSGRQRLQAMLCTPYGALDAVGFGDAPAGWAGDLGCGPDGDPQLAFGLLAESAWRVDRVVADCLSDLEALDAMGPASTDRGCVDVQRAVAAMVLALDADRRRALGEPVAADVASSALAARLMDRWLELFGFVARQTNQLERLDDIVGSAAGGGVYSAPSARIATMVKGVDVLLRPRLSVGWTNLHPSALRSLDYRALFGSASATPGGEEAQFSALPVSLVVGVDGLLRAAEAAIQSGRSDVAERDALAEQASRLVRRALLLVVASSSLVLRARAQSAEPPAWLEDWERGADRLGRAFASLRRAVERLREGNNPLGIDPDLDLPLYRIGDEVTTGARFSALSDYFVGRLGMRGGVAVEAIERAEGALESARQAWADNLLRDFREAVQSSASERRLEAIRRRYGEQVASLCGDPDFDARTVLDDAAEIDADRCFIRPRCRQTPERRVAERAPEEVAFDLCLAERTRRALGPEASGALLSGGYDPADLASLVDGMVRVTGHTVAGDRATVRFADGRAVDVDARLLTFASDVPLPASLDADTVVSMQRECAAVASLSAARRPTELPDACRQHGDCPVGYSCVEGQCEPRIGGGDDPSCFTGALGEVAVSMRAAALDVRAARSRLEELSASYDIAMRACIVSWLGEQEQIRALEAHNATVSTLAAVKLAADVAGNAAEATKDCATAVDAIDDAVSFGVAGGIACGAAAVQQIAQSVSDGMQFAIDEAERQHEVTAARIEARSDYERCVVEAEANLVGLRTASLEIAAATEELGALLVEFFNLKVDVRAALSEGVDAMRREAARAVRPMGIDFWLDERVEAYDAAMRAARRALFLAVLAVEYEYQMSSLERDAVLQARRVADLRGVLDRLRAFVATGTVSGGLPAEMHAVISLRDHLLALSDQQGRPAGWHRMSVEERFRALLRDPRFAVYDEVGRYVGQRVPFRIVPNGTLGLGESGGIPLLTGLDCAERLWSIGASILGDGVLKGRPTEQVRIVVEKRNRFFSQWCDGRVEPPFQFRATRPSRNLIADPLADFVSVNSPDVRSIQAFAEADAFTRARIQPMLEASADELNEERQVPGASRELAGRGLYGEFALLVPAEFLAGPDREGLDLSAIDDILLRIDYVSVAR